MTSEFTCKRCRCARHAQTVASQHSPVEHVNDDNEWADRQQFQSEYGHNLRPRGEQERKVCELVECRQRFWH